MIENRKRILLFIVVITVLAIVLSACGSDNNSSTPATDRNGSEDGATSESPDATELSIMITHANGPYAQQARNDDPYIQELGRLSGYDLEFNILGHGDEFRQQSTVLFASRELPDMLLTEGIDSSAHPGAVESGIFTPLNDLLEEHGQNILANIPDEVWDDPSISKDGEIYMIPQLTGAPYTRVMYIRQDWLDKLEMDQPVTIEEWLEYFEAVKQNDMNGNGDPNDEYGFYARESLLFSDVFFQEFGAYPGAWYFEDGELIPGVIKPEMKDALEFWKLLYDEGYVNPDFFTTGSTDWMENIRSGQAGSWKHSNLNALTSWNPDESTFAEEDVKIAMVDGPEGPGGKGLSLDAPPIYSFKWAIPASSDKSVEAIQFLDWAWSSEKAERFFAFGIEDVNYTVENGEIQWEPNSEENIEAKGFYQLTLNPTGDWRNHDLILEQIEGGDMVKAGFDVAERNVIPNIAMNMPDPEGLATNPDLALYPWGEGLFFDMFAQVVTGRQELEPAFEEFVMQWRSRGGDEVIAEATEWYLNNQ